MSSGVPTRVIAAIGGLAAFAIALIAGLAAENPAEVILGRAVVAMFVCHAVAWIIGAVGERTILESLARSEQPGTAPLEEAPDQPRSKPSEAVLKV